MASGPRLLIVVNDAAFFLSHRLPLASAARDAGFDVHIATPLSDASAAITNAGFPFHAIPLSRRGLSPLGEIHTVSALVRLYRRTQPSIVHHVTAKPILYGGVAARVAGVRAVVHAVSGLGYVFISPKRRARVLRRAILGAYRIATAHPNCAVIFQNADDRQAFGSAIKTHRIVTIPGSGVDLEQFPVTPLPGGVPIVLLPSRMLWDKGVGEFVAAARALAKRGVRARFVLVGGVDAGNPAGVPRKQLENWVREGSVEWWGPQSEMPSVLAKSSLVCLPSYREGMPKALLEACAVGRGIITTDVPGCRDVVAGGDYGLLVRARDAEGLADAVRSVIETPGRLETMGASAARAAQRFAVQHVIARTLELYRSLLQSQS